MHLIIEQEELLLNETEEKIVLLQSTVRSYSKMELFNQMDTRMKENLSWKS